MKNVFDKNDIAEIITRINQLTPDSQRAWGKMNVAQMLAHCNVAYEMVYTEKHPKPNFLIGLFLKLIVKRFVTNETPYKKNLQTAPAFVVVDEKEFEDEKSRLIEFINQTQEHGKSYFENRENLSFGKLSSQGWNNMFYKHLDHHLKQFGA